MHYTKQNMVVTYKGPPTRLSADFSIETLQARMDWQEIFKVMKLKDLQPRLLYLAKLSFRNERASQIRKSYSSPSPPNQLL